MGFVNGSKIASHLLTEEEGIKAHLSRHQNIKSQPSPSTGSEAQ